MNKPSTSLQPHENSFEELAKCIKHLPGHNKLMQWRLFIIVYWFHIM